MQLVITDSDIERAEQQYAEIEKRIEAKELKDKAEHRTTSVVARILTKYGLGPTDAAIARRREK